MDISIILNYGYKYYIHPDILNTTDEAIYKPHARRRRDVDITQVYIIRRTVYNKRKLAILTAVNAIKRKAVKIILFIIRCAKK
jgi:hypothetical protein